MWEIQFRGDRIVALITEPQTVFGIIYWKQRILNKTTDTRSVAKTVF